MGPRVQSYGFGVECHRTFRVGKLALLHRKLERALRPHHGRVLVPQELLLILLRPHILRNLEGEGLLTEAEVLRRDEARKEDVCEGRGSQGPGPESGRTGAFAEGKR